MLTLTLKVTIICLKNVCKIISYPSCHTQNVNFQPSTQFANQKMHVWQPYHRACINPLTIIQTALFSTLRYTRCRTESDAWTTRVHPKPKPHSLKYNLNTHAILMHAPRTSHPIRISRIAVHRIALHIRRKCTQISRLPRVDLAVRLRWSCARSTPDANRPENLALLRCSSSLARRRRRRRGDSEPCEPKPGGGCCWWFAPQTNTVGKAGCVLC